MDKKRTILVMNGPNLQLLGKREVTIYGTETLDDIAEKMRKHASTLWNGAELVFFQSCIEGELVKRIGDAVIERNVDGIIFNPGAYSHYSIALLDALKSLGGNVPVIEVHLSNVHAREEFRKHLVTTQAATGVIAGFGSASYILALDALDKIFKK
ncbi:MAG: 3-dehydroquinate dehydratase [Lentisphaeria bacterium]|nr:3-dehydroquinate dehydratase [Lentisphaeria bacterium]